MVFQARIVIALPRQLRQGLESLRASLTELEELSRGRALDLAREMQETVDKLLN